MCESLHNALPGQEARYSHKNASGDVDVEDVEEGQGDVSSQHRRHTDEEGNCVLR